MIKGVIINKGKAAFMTIWIMSVIRTNADPKMWQVALIGILMYEAILLTIETYHRSERKKARRRNIEAGKEDMRRLEEERILWLKREAR